MNDKPYGGSVTTASTAITRIQAEAAKTTDPDASRTLIGLSSELQKARFDNTP